MPGAFVPLILSFLPDHLRPQWLPGGVTLVRMGSGVGALLALEIQLTLVPAFDSTYMQICHCASCAFVVRLYFVANLLIDVLVGLSAHPVFNLPPRCHLPFFLQLPFRRLLLLIVSLFFSRLLLFNTLCGDFPLRILKFPFLTPGRAGGIAPLKIFFVLEIFFPSGYGPDCFQPFPIVDILSI